MSNEITGMRSPNTDEPVPASEHLEIVAQLIRKITSLETLVDAQQLTISQQRKEFNRAQIQWATDISFQNERYRNLQMQEARAQRELEALRRVIMTRDNESMYLYNKIENLRDELNHRDSVLRFSMRNHVDE